MELHINFFGDFVCRVHTPHFLTGSILSALFSDGSGSLQAALTSTVAHSLLHRYPKDLEQLPHLERNNILSLFVDVNMILCISKVGI